MFIPNIQQLTSTIRVQHRVETKINGQKELSYIDAAIPIHSCNYKPFYGSEAVQSGTVQISEGGTITMWYDSLINVQDRILLNNNIAKPYEIISAENVENRNMYLILKVRRAVNA